MGGRDLGKYLWSFEGPEGAQLCHWPPLRERESAVDPTQCDALLSLSVHIFIDLTQLSVSYKRKSGLYVRVCPFLVLLNPFLFYFIFLHCT